MPSTLPHEGRLREAFPGESQGRVCSLQNHHLSLTPWPLWALISLSTKWGVGPDDPLSSLSSIPGSKASFSCLGGMRNRRSLRYPRPQTGTLALDPISCPGWNASAPGHVPHMDTFTGPVCRPAPVNNPAWAFGKIDILRRSLPNLDVNP